MKRFKTDVKLKSMDVGNEGVIDWFKGLYTGITDKIKQAYEKVFSKKPTETVDVAEIEEANTPANESFGSSTGNESFLGLAASVVVAIPLAIIGYFLYKKGKSSKADELEKEVQERLRTDGDSHTSLSDEEVRKIAHKYSGYAAMFADIKPDIMNKNYYGDLYDYRYDYLNLPYTYDMEDFYSLVKFSDKNKCRFEFAVAKFAKGLLIDNNASIDKELLVDASSSGSYYYSMVNNISNNTALTRIKKILDKPLVPADLYITVSLYDMFVYYFVKFESETKYTYGMDAIQYKQGNSYSEMVYNQIKESTLNRLNKAFEFGATQYSDWYCDLLNGSKIKGLLSDYFKSYNVKVGDNFGADIFQAKASLMLKTAGVFNNPSLYEATNKVIHNSLVSFTSNYYVDVVKLKLYFATDSFDDATKLILAK